MRPRGSGRSRVLRLIFLQLQLGNQSAMYFVGTVRDAQGANGGIEFGQGNIVGNAGGAVHLNCPVDNFQGDVGYGNFNLRDFAASALGADFIEHPGSLESQKTGLLQHDPGIGNDIGIRAQFCQRLAKGHTTERTAAHKLKRAFGRSERAHAVMDAAGAEPSLCDFKTPARSSNYVIERQTDVREANLAVTGGRIIRSKYRPHALDPDTRSIERNQNHGMALMLGGAAIGNSHENQYPAMRMSDPRTPPLQTVEDDLLSLDERRSLHVCRARR